MLTEMQNWRETLKVDGKPDRLCNQFRPVELLTDEPIYQFMFGKRKKGTTTISPLGVTIAFPENVPGAMPHVTKENKVCPDVTRWRETVHIPDLDAQNFDWSAAEALAAKVDRENHPLILMMIEGIFEMMHSLMGFEDTLINFYEEPEAMAELIQALADFRFRWVQLLVEHLHPNVICSHDDWGSKTSLFMQPDMWREFFKPHYKKFYEYQKENGVVTMHHADSYMEPIALDMAEIGIDIWQGVLPSNNIPKMQEELQGRMVLMGGIDAGIVDRENSTEEEIRAETRRACETYGPGGHFIPSMTYGRPGSSIFKRTYQIIEDEIDKYNQEHFG